MLKTSMKCVLLLVILCGSFLNLYSQNPDTFENDSILYLQSIDSVKLNLRKDFSKSQKFLKQASSISQKYSNYRWTYNVMKLQSVSYFFEKDVKSLDKAINMYEAALDFQREKIGDSIEVSALFQNLSRAYARKGNLPNALSYAQKSLAILKSNESDKIYADISLVLGGIGNLYFQLGLYNKSIKSYYEAISYYDKSKDRSSVLPNFNYQLYLYIGKIQLYNLKEYEKALINIKKAKEGYEKKNYHIGIVNALTLLGEVYKELDLYEEALPYYTKSLVLSEEIKFTSGTIIAHLQAAELYILQEKAAPAITHLNKVEIELRDYKNLELEKLYLEFMAKAYELQNNEIKALTYFRKAGIIEDSINKLLNIPKTTEILLEEETRKQKALEENFFNKITKKNKVLITLSLVILILSLSIYLIFYKYKSKFKFLRKSKTALETKLQASNQQNDYLYRQMTTAAANLAIKNDILQRLSATLAQIKEQNKSREVQKNLENAQYLIRDNLELSKIWDDFFMHFEQVHPQFLERLKKQFDLSPTELRLCAFVKMNLSYKEIASLLNIKVNSIQVGVHRIKTKMNLKKNESVFDFIYTYDYELPEKI